MSKKAFFVSGFKGDDRFVDHALEIQERGVVREGWEQTPTEAQVVGSKRRVRHKDAAIGLDSTDVHMGNDRVVVEAEIPDPKSGDITQVVHRYSDAGRYSGSYSVVWEKTAEGRHTLARTKRIFY